MVYVIPKFTSGRAGFEHGLPPATRMRWPATRLHKETPVMLSQRGLRPPTLPGSSGGPAGRRPMSGTGVAKWQCLLTRRGAAGRGGQWNHISQMLLTSNVLHGENACGRGLRCCSGSGPLRVLSQARTRYHPSATSPNTYQSGRRES